MYEKLSLYIEELSTAICALYPQLLENDTKMGLALGILPSKIAEATWKGIYGAVNKLVGPNDHCSPP